MSKIEWTDVTWNPLRGCSRVAEGCRHCYAERQAIRHAGEGRAYEGLAKMTPAGPRWTGQVRFVKEKLWEPLGWKKPRRVFVNSMSDLFHEKVFDQQIAAIFGVKGACPQHIFQVLTKRPRRMREWFEWVKRTAHPKLFGSVLHRAEVIDSKAVAQFVPGPHAEGQCVTCHGTCRFVSASPDAFIAPWPLPNVWLGVSASTQVELDKAMPELMACPAALRWVSLEPMIEQMDIRAYLSPNSIEHAMLRLQRGLYPLKTYSEVRRLDWVVVGGESGPGARQCDVAWIRSIIQQCRLYGVPVFVKQLGAAWYDERNGRHGPGLKPAAELVDGLTRLKAVKGNDMREWSEDLRIREVPR